MQPASRTHRCLVLGPPGAGKSLLVKKLKSFCDRSLEKDEEKEDGEEEASREILPTLSTVGRAVEQLRLAPDCPPLLLQEYGGCMAPLWRSACAECDLLLYVIDASDSTRLAGATILLLELLAEENLKETPFLLFFNKLDCACALSVAEYQSVMRLRDIRRHASPAELMEVVEGSAANGRGLPQLWKWLRRYARSWW